MTTTRGERRKSRAEARRSMQRRLKAGLHLPQSCPRCKQSLADSNIPAEYREFAALFTIAWERDVREGGKAWQCPYCDHLWRDATQTLRLKGAKP